MKLDARDVVMIGAGPSALAAAIYTTREDIDTVLYEKATIGGLAAITDIVDNYPGFPEGIEGDRWARCPNLPHLNIARRIGRSIMQR